MFSFVDIHTGKSREFQVVRFLSYFITKQQEKNSRGAFLAIQGTTVYLFFLPKAGRGGGEHISSHHCQSQKASERTDAAHSHSIKCLEHLCP